MCVTNGIRSHFHLRFVCEITNMSCDVQKRSKLTKHLITSRAMYVHLSLMFQKCRQTILFKLFIMPHTSRETQCSLQFDNVVL